MRGWLQKLDDKVWSYVMTRATFFHCLLPLKKQDSKEHQHFQATLS